MELMIERLRKISAERKRATDAIHNAFALLPNKEILEPAVRSKILDMVGDHYKEASFREIESYKRQLFQNQLD